MVKNRIYEGIAYIKQSFGYYEEALDLYASAFIIETEKTICMSFKGEKCNFEKVLLIF